MIVNDLDNLQSLEELIFRLLISVIYNYKLKE